MKTKSRFKFNGKRFGNAIYKSVAEEQTKRLIAYAKKELEELILSREFKDRTRNLADSYIWCVYFQGKQVEYGTYGRKQARKQSLLHEYSPAMSVPVNGRKLALEFAKVYKPMETQGWEIVFAACAPYGAYLEAGFTFHGKSHQFDVMSQRYDIIRQTLSPLCNVSFYVSPPQY